MAYIDQEKKKQLSPKIKAILKKYGVKGTLSVRDHLTLVCTISQGPIDFIGNYNATGKKRWLDKFIPSEDYMQINHHWYHEHFTGKAREFLAELIPAMNVGNHNNNDIMTDYFDVGWYIDINIGKWNKPYQFIE